MQRGVRRTRTRRSALAALALALAFHASAGAHARAVPASEGGALDAEVTWADDGVPRLTVAGARLADAGLRARIGRGEPVTLELRIDAVDDDRGVVIASARRRCRVTYDAWTRRHDVHVDGEHVAASTTDETLARCLDVETLAIGASAAWERGSRDATTFSVTVALNPLTRDAARDLAGWLQRSEGGLGEPTLFGARVAALVSARSSPERVLGTWVLRPRSGERTP